MQGNPLLIEYLKCEVKEAKEILNSLKLEARVWWDYPTVAAEGKRLKFQARLKREMDYQRAARAHQRLEKATELAKMFDIALDV